MDTFTSTQTLTNAYKGLDAGLQLGAGAGQLLLGTSLARGGAATGNSSLVAGGAYVLTAGTANIQGAGRKYFNIAVNEDFLPTGNFLQSTYENIAKKVGLDPKVGTAAYNIAELGTGLYGEFKPTKIADDWNYGLTITGPKYTLPISQESGAVLGNSVLGLGKASYDTFTSTMDAVGSQNLTTQNPPAPPK